ncbi:hypothetical protein SAMN05421664_0224 [Chryseobacterium soldanellicola]|uniref:Uncharacterized protein n=1 Tax=Chryseobacterium soldanellicola TaxID=311333 RepID=A0A1H0XSJ9_9FLAO|nr:hypothetical protein [Chryseobacterium soldanellicola]SDQ05872.1 hypothetical protein SAMN05421664_0224 [Chryseobacterium soldanellicola]
MKKQLLFFLIALTGLFSTVIAQVGINTSTPHAPLQFKNETVNRKIVLYETVNDDNQYYGFGVNPGVLRYQTDVTATDHAFFAGTGATTSNELMRIKGTGNVGIATSAPLAKLDIIGTTFGIRNSVTSGSWDNLWFNVTPSIPSINASGAESGLQFNVGSNSVGAYGDSQTLTTVATMLATGNMGVGTTTPTNKLDVNGTTRVRTITPVSGATVVTPVYSDANGVLVKASPSATYGGLTSNTSGNILSGATGTVITGMVDGGIYKAVVIVGDACADIGTAEFYVNNISSNSYFSINGLGGLLSSGGTNKSPAFNQVNRNTITVTWTGKVGCAGGDNPTSFNYTLTIPSAGTINVTNNGNITKAYTIVLTRIN